MEGKRFADIEPEELADTLGELRALMTAIHAELIDVIIEGISLVSNFRDQFKEVLARGGPEALLEQLRAKNAAPPVGAS